MKNGIYEYVNETVSGDSYHFSCTWTLNAPELPSGVYFYTLRVGDFTATKKMILMK